MSDPFVRAQGRGCAMQLVALVVAPLILGVILLVALGAGSLAPDGGAARPLVFGAVIVALTVTLAGATLAFAARRARVLDPGFARLGVPGSAFLINVREYHGVWQGREVDALYSRRGPLLETSVGARLHGALAVGTRTAAGEVLRGALGLTAMTLHDPAFAPFIVSASDPAWAAGVLGDPAVRDGVLRALSDPSGRELRVLALRPGAVRLMRRYFDPEAAVEEVAPMVALLGSIGAAAERLPAPATPVVASALEQAARKAPGALGVRVVAAVFAVVLVVVLGLTAAILWLTPAPSRPSGGAVAPAPGPEAPWGTRRRRR
jgi:hypothetical protein